MKRNRDQTQLIKGREEVLGSAPEQAVTGLVFAAIGRDGYTRASALWAGFKRAHLVEIESCLLRSFRQLMKSPAVRKKPQITSDGRRSGAKTIA